MALIMVSRFVAPEPRSVARRRSRARRETDLPRRATHRSENSPMTQHQPLPSSESWVKQAELLLELLPLDTAYADLYLERARQLAAAVLSPVDYRALKLADEG